MQLHKEGFSGKMLTTGGICQYKENDEKVGVLEVVRKYRMHTDVEVTCIEW